MNTSTLDTARRRIPSVSVLVNMVSMRVRQLIMGYRPLVKPEHPYEDKENIALREITEGKLVAEIDLTEAKIKTRDRL